MLKLYVWEDVLKDPYAGVMFALAPDVGTARAVIAQNEREDNGYISPTLIEDLKKEPKVYTELFGMAIWGGG
jgi:hypothetical protein